MIPGRYKKKLLKSATKNYNQKYEILILWLLTKLIV